MSVRIIDDNTYVLRVPEREKQLIERITEI